MYKLKDFEIIPTDKFNNLDLTMFTYVPSTPNEAYQHSIQEKIRAFNNSCLYLYDFYKCICDNFKIINLEPWDSENNRRLRQLFGMMYKELFTYQEKIVKFVVDMLHIEDDNLNTTEKSLKEIKRYSKYFKFIKDFVEKCNQIKRDTEYIDFRNIRADEVHNINRWDLVNYNFINTGSGISILPISYQISSEYFYNNLMKTVEMLIDLKQFVESFVTEQNIRIINSICRINK